MTIFEEGSKRMREEQLIGRIALWMGENVCAHCKNQSVKKCPHLRGRGGKCEKYSRITEEMFEECAHQSY
jgi:hypothetical protein